MSEIVKKLLTLGKELPFKRMALGIIGSNSQIEGERLVEEERVKGIKL